MLLVIEAVGEPCLGGRKAIDCDISKGMSSSDDDDAGDMGAGDADREEGDEILKPSRDKAGEFKDRGDRVVCEGVCAMEARRLLVVTVKPEIAMLLDLSLYKPCSGRASGTAPLASVR